MKKLISLLMTIAVLLSVLQPAWAIEEAAEIDAVAASRNLIVVVPGIIGSELVDGNGAKVWVGVGGILGQIQCNEVGNPVYPLYAYNNDNYGARDTYKTLYALSAGRSVFITSTGYTTVQKVNYSLSGGQYSVSSYIGTNDGDGTVPSTSAQNRLSNTDTHVVRVVNAGNHTDMLSNPNTLTKVYQYVSQTLAGNSLSAIEENEVGNTHVNEKGWVVGEGIDGRRVRVIIRGSSMPTIVSSTGEPYTLIGEQLYVGDEAIEDNYVGECWEVSDGYQFEMMRGAHKFVYDDDTKEGFSVEVSYMENGYYEAMQTYEIKETEGTYELSTWESVQKQPEMTVNNGIVVEEVEPSSIFNGLELQRLNVD